MWGFSRVANGNISGFRFVKLDTTTANRVLQCGAGDQIYGVAFHGTRNAPYTGLDDGYLAIAGEELAIWGFGQGPGILLALGGTVTQGDRLKADADGRGVKTTTANDEIGAYALVSGVALDVIPVMVIGPMRY